MKHLFKPHRIIVKILFLSIGIALSSNTFAARPISQDVLDNDGYTHSENNCTVYVILDIEVTNWEIFPEYQKKVGAAVQQYGGRFISKGGDVTPLFGNWPVNRIVVVEFQSKEQVKACIESPEYLSAKVIRDKSAKTKGIMIEGCE